MRGLRVGAGVLLGVGAALSAARADEPRSPWRDAKVVEARFAEACDAVEKATGAKFAARPAVRIVELPDDVRRIRDDRVRSLEDRGTPTAMSVVFRSGVGDRFARYRPERHDVRVFPDAADEGAVAFGEPTLSTEDVLRVALVHAACHAMDYPKYGWRKPEGSSVTLEERLAFDAVAEGHAQLVAEDLAKAWGLGAAFDAFTRATLALPPVEDEAVGRLARVLLEEASFGLRSGLPFLRAVQAAQGPVGVEAVLRSPPTDTRLVEHPRLWLFPGATEGAPDLGVLLAGLAYLVGEPGWKVTEQRMRRPLLEYEMARYEAGVAAPGFDEIDDARMLGGQLTGEDVRLGAMALLFREEARAQAFVDSWRQDLRSRAVPLALTITDGAGPGGAVAGFTLERTRPGTDPAKHLLSEVALLGRTVLSVSGTGAPWLSRGVLDEAVARAAAWADEPSRSLPPHAALVVPRTAPSLTVRVLDGAGMPVPGAQAALWGDALSTSSRRRGVRDGAVVFTPGAGLNAWIDVWAAVATDGSPLPLGAARVAVGPDDAEVEVRLDVEKAIEGRIVSESGSAVRGLYVTAVPLHVPPAPPAPDHGSAASRIDGTFRIGGLCDMEYRLDFPQTGVFVRPPSPVVRGGTTGVTITLRRGVLPIVTVLDRSGAPVVGARVVVTRVSPAGDEEVVAEARADGEGKAKLPALDPSESLRLEVSGPDGTAGFAVHAGADWKAADGTVVLEAGPARPPN